MDHRVIVSDALGGVEVCVPEEVNDDIGKIHLPEGTYKVNGAQALIRVITVAVGSGAQPGLRVLSRNRCSWRL